MPTAEKIPTKLMKVSALVPYENNAKLHSENQISRICDSINEFGFKVPIEVDENMVILAGHGRRLACIELGLDKVPVIVHSGLNEKQKIAYRAAHNKLGEIGGGYDEDLLKFDLASLDAELMRITGWDFVPAGFSPSLEPKFDTSLVTAGDVAGAVQTQESTGTQGPSNEQVMCPECGHEFTVR